MSGIRLEPVPFFPRGALGGSGIDVVKQNGNWFLSLDYSKFPIIAPYTPQAWHEVLIFDQNLQQYFLVPATEIKAVPPVTAGPTDPYWLNVVLLLGFEATNGATSGTGFGTFSEK